MIIEAATARDLPDVHDLLSRHQLPIDGVDDHVQTMLVAGRTRRSSAVRRWRSTPMVRCFDPSPSTPPARPALGHQLTEAALQLARAHGARTVFLLTTTAEKFFPQFGFEQIAREDVPPVGTGVGGIHVRVPHIGNRDAEASDESVMAPDAGRRLTAEAVGTALLLAAVVGSGIMADRLAAGNQAIALLANTIATGAALVALILTFGPISGAHFNPAVTIADASQGGLAWREVPGYLCAQIGGAVLGVWAAHLMFGEPVFMLSRASAQWVGADVQRVRGHVRLARRHLGMFTTPHRHRAIRGRRLHHIGILVYGLDFVRKSRGDVCPRR